MLRADTLKMNKIACEVSLKSQKKLRELGKVGINIPMGYIFKNNILAYMGPSITVKMEPIGQIETKYVSEFETGGINQTRHKIYVHVKTNLRVIFPMKSSDVEVDNEMPVSETIIVGKVPNTALQMDLKGAGFKLDNGL
jgi:sporulation protein YunB